MSEVWKETLALLASDKSYKNMFHMMERFGGDVAAEMTEKDGSEVVRTYNDYIRLSYAAADRFQKLMPEGFGSACAEDVSSVAGNTAEGNSAAAGNSAAVKSSNNGESAEGRTIGFMYDTCMDWPVIFWAVLMSGGIPLLMNPATEPELAIRILDEAGAKAYIASKPVPGCNLKWVNAAEILGGGASAAGVQGDGASASAGNISGDGEQTDRAGLEKWSDYVALCTSGTTGNSRIFLYDSATIANHILSFDEAKQTNVNMPFDETKPCKLLAFLPFHHVFGFSVIYILYSITGKTLVYMKDKSVNTLLSTCQNHGVTHLYCVPMFFNALAKGIRKQVPAGIPMIGPIKKKIQSKTLGTNILSMITGGGHVPDETLKTINGIGFPLVNGFGMTESGIISVELSMDNKQRVKGSIGIPFKLTEYRIEDENGLAANAGELLIRGGALYTASIIDKKIVPRDRDAWFHTGDLVRKNADGLFIDGRIKDVIINASGENVYPDEIEDKFSGLPGISKISILGIDNGNYEEVAIVAESAGDVDKAMLVEMVKKINGTLNANHKVTMLFLSKEPLPVSGSMKVKRQLLRKDILAGDEKYEDLQLYGAARVARGEEVNVEVDVSEEIKEAEQSAEVIKSEGAEQVSNVDADAAEGTATGAAQNNEAAPYENEEEFKEIIASIRAIVAEEFMLEDNNFDNYGNFIAELGGDSLTVFNIINTLEEQYGVTILDENMTPIENIHEMACKIYELKNQ